MWQELLIRVLTNPSWGDRHPRDATLSVRKERAFGLSKSTLHHFFSIIFNLWLGFCIPLSHLYTQTPWAKWKFMETWEATFKIQFILVVFPLVVQWRFTSKLEWERTRSSQLLTRTWRTQVHIDLWAWRVHNVFVYYNYLVWWRFSTGGRGRGFSEVLQVFLFLNTS